MTHGLYFGHANPGCYSVRQTFDFNRFKHGIWIMKDCVNNFIDTLFDVTILQNYSIQKTVLFFVVKPPGRKTMG